MKVVEIALSGRQTLQFHGRTIATMEVCDCNALINCLALHFSNGSELVLPAAVDVSEQLDRPRIFLFEGTDRNMFMVFGGEKTYWITTEGRVKDVYPLFREKGYEEYWTTRIIESGDRLVIIYESGVLLIDASLRVCWHVRKYFNDEFVGSEGGLLKFVVEDTEWTMRLDDGSTSPTYDKR